jgi:hypothetical protein
MLIQYLVGLCCLKWDPDAVEVRVGDMIYDPAAEKKRDIDITVTVGGQLLHAFKAYEVKHESSPLDIPDVEQLCIKMSDIPSLTHRGIVSSSGFTAGAQKKAAYHGIDLYEIRQWIKPLKEQFPQFAMDGTAEECFPMRKELLHWNRWSIDLVVLEAKASFSVKDEDKLLDSKGRVHGKYPAFADFQSELLLRSTEILFKIDPASTIRNTYPIPFTAPDGQFPAGPEWPHTHSLDVTKDDVWIELEDKLCQIDLVTISGYLQWQCSGGQPRYYVVEKVPTGEPFAGALISTEQREGHMIALVFSPTTSEIGINFVRLAEKHRNCIRNLTLDLPSTSEKISSKTRVAL